MARHSSRQSRARKQPRSSDTEPAQAAEQTTLCPVCDGTGGCRGCAQRRMHAWTLVHTTELSVEQAAARMKLTPGAVRRFVALHDDWLELQSFRRNSIPAQTALAMLYAEQRRQPGLKRAEVARRMKMPQSQLDRMLGLASTNGSADPAKRRIGIPQASALARALGRAPHELDGC